MSIYKINPDDVESFTIVTNPSRTYESSSVGGVTGSLNVFSRRSHIEKDNFVATAFVDQNHDDSDVGSLLKTLQQAAKMSVLSPSSSLSGTLNSMLLDYMNKVDDLEQSTRKNSTLDISRYTPSVDFSTYTARKLFIKDVLSSYYRVSYPSAHWGYTNFNSLNFFTSSTVPESSVLLYPNIRNEVEHSNHMSGVYTLSGAFSFDFYINPRYRPEKENDAFKAGTIYHLSSCYSLSLVTGSGKNENGLVEGYRLLLQLSHSADVSPSLALPGAYPSNLVFLSDDNSLSFNRWHHVVVRWGTNSINDGSGSFNIDGLDKGIFVVPSGTITPQVPVSGGNSDVLCIGNYYQGNNVGSNSQALFFAADASLREGLTQLVATTGVDEPTSYTFAHPLNAELHDVSIKRYYMADIDILTSASAGPRSIDSNWTALYIPPFFVESSSFRQSVGSYGGIWQTPFFEVDGTTNDPFNVAMSFGINANYINIENYLKDFANNQFPRALKMSGTILATTSDVLEANLFLYRQPGIVRRNLLIMPCDDGLFVPGFELLSSESLKTTLIDDLGVEELSMVNLSSMLSTSSLLFGSDFGSETKSIDEANSFANELIGFTPENPTISPGSAFDNYVSSIDDAVALGTFEPGIQTGAPLTIFQRTRDASSNHVTFFDISNLFYGKRIMPRSLVLTDAAFTGSSGKMSITLNDDGRGTLYRANCLTSQSTWNNVGTVFYDEGIICIKNPHLNLFGKEGFELSFRGEQNVHVLKISALAPRNQLNSSSNPNFKQVPPSAYPNDPDDKFVYITGMYFHDDNYNVIMKTQLAQPIVKREGDAIRFTVKMDF